MPSLNPITAKPSPFQYQSLSPSTKPSPRPTPLPSQKPTANPTTKSPSNQPTTSPTEQIFLGDTDICLSNPEDIYRTCFQRATPSNGLDEDQILILRREYNIGAALYERNITSSDLAYIHPYTPPNVTSDEDGGANRRSCLPFNGTCIRQRHFRLTRCLITSMIVFLVGEKRQ